MADNEALRLADALENPTIQAPAFRHEVVAELRRLAGVEAERDALREILDHIPQVEAELAETSEKLHAMLVDVDALLEACAAYSEWADKTVCTDPELRAIRQQMRAAIARVKGGGNG